MNPSVLGIGAAAALGLAGNASADFLLLSGEGLYTITSSTGGITSADWNETLTVDQGPYPFVSLVGDTSVQNNDFTGSVILTDSAGDELELLLSGSIFSVNPLDTVAGTWSVVSGTGAYASLTGSGTWNSSMYYNNAKDPDEAQTRSFFGGTLVPAPGAVALTGIGALCMGVRRRR